MVEQEQPPGVKVGKRSWVLTFGLAAAAISAWIGVRAIVNARLAGEGIMDAWNGKNLELNQHCKPRYSMQTSEAGWLRSGSVQEWEREIWLKSAEKPGTYLHRYLVNGGPQVDQATEQEYRQHSAGHMLSPDELAGMHEEVRRNKASNSFTHWRRGRWFYHVLLAILALGALYIHVMRVLAEGGAWHTCLLSATILMSAIAWGTLVALWPFVYFG